MQMSMLTIPFEGRLATPRKWRTVSRRRMQSCALVALIFAALFPTDLTTILRVLNHRNALSCEVGNV